MTLTDNLIPYWYWLKCGLAEISLPMSIVNFLMIVILMFSTKGIDITMYAIPIVCAVMIAGLTFIGWFGQHYGIYGRINTLINQKMNPEMKQISDDVKLIKKMLEERR